MGYADNRKGIPNLKHYFAEETKAIGLLDVFVRCVVYDKTLTDC